MLLSLHLNSLFQDSYLQNLKFLSIKEGAVLDTDDSGPGIDFEGTGWVLQDVEELAVSALKRGDLAMTVFDIGKPKPGSDPIKKFQRQI